MKYFYITLRSVFLFYFIASFFSGVLLIGDETFQSLFLPALVFGLVCALTPIIIGFFKVRENSGSLFLLGLILIFSFFCVGYFGLDWFTFQSGSINFGSESLIVNLNEPTITLVLVSVLLSIINVILDLFYKRKY